MSILVDPTDDSVTWEGVLEDDLDVDIYLLLRRYDSIVVVFSSVMCAALVVSVNV